MTLGDLALNRATLDRAAALRTDAEALERLWKDPATLVLDVLPESRFAVRDDPPVLVLRPPGDEDVQRRVVLGLDEAGTAYFAVLPEIDDGGRPADPGSANLRDVGGLLPARDVGIAVNAVALANWHATHTHCPRCGAGTRVTFGGHVRECPADGSLHYPRTDPAVIMAVVDEDDRLLLGRQARWPERRYSTLAGFVEPGESLEQAVRREVGEEAGVEVGDVDYLGSQAWPFPASLMLGFVARARTVAISVDGEEIAQARWLSRAELADAVSTGQVLLPPRVSIARRLIEHWYGGEVGAEGTWR
jgi:NAD+ diphosphatase